MKINSLPNSSLDSYSPEAVEMMLLSQDADQMAQATSIISEVPEPPVHESVNDPAELQAGEPVIDDLPPTLINHTVNLIAERLGGGIETDVGVQGFCVIGNYIVMAIVRDGNARIYLVDKENPDIIYDSLEVDDNHANVLCYDPKDGIIFVGNSSQTPVMLELHGDKLSISENTCERKGQILYNEENDLFIVANGTNIDVYDKDGKPMIPGYSLSVTEGYTSQGKATYGNYIYYCQSNDNPRGNNIILVYDITTGKLIQTIHDNTKEGTLSELEQVYFDDEGNMYTNYNNGNDFYETDYNYYEQLG